MSTTTTKTNIKKHGVDFEQVHAFYWDSAIVAEDNRCEYGEKWFNALGLLFGRLHVLTFTMRGISFKKPTKRLHAMQANKYDHDGDVVELGEDFFQNAKPVADFPELQQLVNTRGKQLAPTKQQTTIRLDKQVVEFFKSAGKGWQTRVNDVLRAYVDKNS